MSSRTATLAAAPGQEMHPAGHPAAGPPGVMHFSQPLVPVAPPGVAAQTQEAQSASEFTHLCTTFGDCIEALPPTLTRSISDLRELDAVLSGSISTITDQLNELLAALQDPSITAQHRFHLLRRIADEAKDFRLGGEDKIRVATGTCETLIHHTNQLDVLAGLLSTLLPTSMAGTIPPPSWPHGYPILFPTQASASGSAYRKPDFLPSSQAYGRHPAMLHNPSAMGYTHANGYYTTRQQELYSHAADSVRNYVKEGAALPDEHRIKHHVKKQRQDTSLHAGGKSRNNTSHMPTSEHKHRGGKPAPNPTLAASSSQFSNLHSVPTGINHLGQLGGMSATMAATSSAQSQIPASPLLVHPGGGHPRLSFDKDGNPLPPMLVDPNDPSELSYGREMNGSAQVVPSASAAMPAAKKRRTSNKDKQFSQSDYGENAGGEGQDDYVPPASVSRDRQNSSRGAMQGQSAQGTAAAGSKRSRNNSKKGGLDSPDPGSPFAASASGRSAAGVQAPKRKSSQLLEQHDVDTLARPASRNAGNNVGPASVHEGSRLAAATVADAADLEADLDMVGDDADDGEGNDGGDDTRTYCYCDRVSFGNMIGCDGEDCAREWFHLACVGMDTPPKGEWYCDDCEEKRKRELHLGKPKKR